MFVYAHVCLRAYACMFVYAHVYVCVHTTLATQGHSGHWAFLWRVGMDPASNGGWTQEARRCAGGRTYEGGWHIVNSGWRIVNSGWRIVNSEEGREQGVVTGGDAHDG